MAAARMTRMCLDILTKTLLGPSYGPLGLMNIFRSVAGMLL